MKGAHTGPVEADVPLGIQMGDDPKYIAGLHNLTAVGDTKIYKLTPGNNLPPMFEAIILESHELTGIGKVHLITRNYIKEGEEVYLQEWRGLLSWLNRKYGEGVKVSEEEDNNLAGVIWVGRDLSGPDDVPHLRGNVSHISMSGTYSRRECLYLNLIYAFSNWKECDEANQMDRYKGL